MLENHIYVMFLTMFRYLDLREDRHYLSDHPGLSPVTTSQGEELRKHIGATYYIECSSKTQQVHLFMCVWKLRSH
jgi:hypothetical protein